MRAPLRFPYEQVVRTTEAIDDPRSRYYNRIVDRAVIKHPDWSSSESMLGVGGRYRFGVMIEHNWSKIPGLGSCIFLHVWGHTSGIIYEAPGEPIDEIYRQVTDGDSLEDLVSQLARLPLKYHPGTQFEYGFSTDVLGRVLEIVSGQRLDEILNTRLLEPLGMVDTTFSVQSARKDRLAKVYQHVDNGALKSVPPLQGEIVEGQRKYPSGGAGLFSTLDDFARFGQMLCNGGELAGVRVIARKTCDLMVSNHLSGLAVPFHNKGVGHGFGLGVAVRLDNGLAGTLGTIGSFGWTGMATTFCWIDPAEKLVALCFAQHLPHDEHGLFQRFTNLAYQALA